MAFKQVNMNRISLKDGGIGVAHVGVYQGLEVVPSKMTKSGTQNVWNFLDEEGLPYSLYGFTNLDRSMSCVKAGTLCRITYQGTKIMDTKFQKNQAVHQVTVEIDVKDNDDKDKIPF